MKVSDALQGVVMLGLDAAPIIYFLEGHSVFGPLCAPFFAAVGSGQVQAVASTLVQAETLVQPLRRNHLPLIAAFRNFLSATQGITTFPVSLDLAERAADLRARYNLRTADSVHIATAFHAGCDAFLTNDADLRRVSEIRVIVLKELTL